MKRSVVDFLEKLNLPLEGSRRTDCPTCGGKGTFSARRSVAGFSWNCFRASCGERGKETNGNLSLVDISRITKPASRTSPAFRLDKNFVGPGTDAFSLVVIEYLRKFPAAAGYLRDCNYRDVALDIKESRIVFLSRDFDGAVVDAVGRALDASVKPKWRRYGNSNRPLIVGNPGGIGVLVEDAISAVSVTATGAYTGIALMGTSLLGSITEWACKFKGIVVCLDYDASLKALEIVKRLSWYVPSIACVLHRDLKWLTNEDIAKQLEPSRRVLA